MLHHEPSSTSPSFTTSPHFHSIEKCSIIDTGNSNINWRHFSPVILSTYILQSTSMVPQQSLYNLTFSGILMIPQGSTNSSKVSSSTSSSSSMAMAPWTTRHQRWILKKIRVAAPWWGKLFLGKNLQNHIKKIYKN